MPRHLEVSRFAAPSSSDPRGCQSSLVGNEPTSGVAAAVRTILGYLRGRCPSAPSSGPSRGSLWPPWSRPLSCLLRWPTPASSRRLASRAQSSAATRVCGSDLDTGVPGLGIDLCHYDFYVEPARDGDPDHAYTVDWIQFALEPQSGYCVADAQGSIGVQDASIIASAPSRRSRSGRNTVELRLASPDRTLGSLRQRFRLARGTTSTDPRRSPTGDRLHWRWRGRSRDPIHLVVGVAFAHPITEPRPPTDLDFRLTSTPC